MMRSHAAEAHVCSLRVSMSDVTRILSQIEDGNALAAEELLPLVYEELRKLAAAKLANERPGQTLQAQRYTQYIEANPGESRWYYPRAHAYLRLRNEAEAIADFHRFLELSGSVKKPPDQWTALNRSVVWCILRQWQQAITECSELVRAHQDWTAPWGIRAFALARLGQYDKAVDDYNRALQLEPDNQLQLERRSRIYAQMGEWQKARADSDRLVELNPTSASAKNNLAWLLPIVQTKSCEMPNDQSDWQSKLSNYRPDTRTFTILWE